MSKTYQTNEPFQQNPWASVLQTQILLIPSCCSIKEIRTLSAQLSTSLIYQGNTSQSHVTKYGSFDWTA